MKTHTHTHTQSSCHPWLILFTTFLSEWTYVLVWSMLFFLPNISKTCSLLVLRGEKIVKPIGVKFSHMGFNNFHIWGKNCLNCLTKFTPYVQKIGEKIVKPMCEYFANSLVWKRCNKHYLLPRVDTFTLSQSLEHIWKDSAYIKITYIGPSEPAPIGTFYWLCFFILSHDCEECSPGAILSPGSSFFEELHGYISYFTCCWFQFVLSLNNPQNKEMKICENMNFDMLKIIIIILGYTLNNFITHITI